MGRKASVSESIIAPGQNLSRVGAGSATADAAPSARDNPPPWLASRGPPQAVRFAPMNEVFEGNRLETGVLQRARQWRDAIPALVLIDALRVAGSPLHVGCIWLTLALQGWLVSLAFITPPAIAPPVEFSAASESVTGVDPRAWMQSLAELGLVRGGGLLGASLLLWLLPAAIVARAGACYVAGRPQSFSVHVRTVASRWGSLLGLFAIPLAAMLLLLGGMMLIGTLGRLPLGSLNGGSLNGGSLSGTGAWLGAVAVVLALPLAILTGLLLAGSIAALPLGMVAVVIEKQHDAFDSVSRGYEYVFRRPIQLAFYLVCSAGLLFVIGIAARAIAYAAAACGEASLAIGSGGEALPRMLGTCLSSFSSAIVVTAAWGSVGAIYLLMRQAANDQEIEDIAVSPVDLREPELPVLRQGVSAAEQAVSNGE